MKLNILQYPLLSYIICSFLFLSCGKNKYKEYDKVNVVKEERPEKRIKPHISFPAGFKTTEQIIIESAFSNVNISSWPLDSIIFKHSNYDSDEMDIELYEGQNQIIYREKSDSSFNGDLEIKVPATLNVNLKSQYGDVHIKNIKGTFDVNVISGNVLIEDCESAMKILSQSGNILAKNWSQRGRSKLSAASGSVIIKSSDDLNYALNMHSGSDTAAIYLNGNNLNCNIKAIKFKGKGILQSDFDFSDPEDLYSDALEIYYEQYDYSLSENAPQISISTGDGLILLNK